MTIASLIIDVAANTVKLQRDVEQVNGTLNKVTQIASTVGKALAAAFTITAIVAAGKKVLDFAGQLTDLSAQTGISTRALQKWGLAFEQSGVSLDQVTRAAGELATRLIGGDKGVVQTLQKLGLSVEDLKRMRPEDQFTTVADAVGKIQNKSEQLFASKTLFGKGGVDLLAGLNGKLKETTDEFERMGLIMSEETVKAADDFGDQLGLMGKQMLAILASIVGPLLPALSALGNVLLWIGQHIIGPVFNVAAKALVTTLGVLWAAIAELLAKLAEMAQRIPIVGKHLGFLAGTSEWLHQSASGAMEHVRGLWQETEKVGAAAETATPKLIGLTGQIADQSKKSHEAALGIVRYAEAYRDAHHMMDTVNREVMERIGARNDLALEKQFAAMARWQQFQKQLAGNLFAAPATLFMRSEGVSQEAKGLSFMQGIKGSFESMLKGLTGGNGMAGFFGKVGSGIAKGFGNIISGGVSGLISSGVGLAVQGIGKLFGGLFGRESPEMKAAKKNLFDLKGQAYALGIQLDHTFRLKTLADYERAIKKVQGAIQDHAEDQERLQKAIEKYGFSIEQLGPALRQQRLHDQARELIEDWRVLVASGIDLTLVNEKMADSINEYLRLAIRTGAEVPVAFQPILQKMIEQGLLLDENGVAITDLGQLQIQWSQTMTQGFDRVVTKLQELIDKLVAAGTAIDNIPKSVDIEVNYSGPGGLPPPPEVPQLGTGGIVTRPTLAMIGEQGPEAVVPLRGGGLGSGVVAAIDALRDDLRRSDQKWAYLFTQMANAT